MIENADIFSCFRKQFQHINGFITSYLGMFKLATLRSALLVHTDRDMSSRCLQMPRCQIGARPSATTMLTGLWLYSHLSNIVWHKFQATAIKQEIVRRMREVCNPLVYLLLAGSPSHIHNAPWYSTHLAVRKGRYREHSHVIRLANQPYLQ